MEKLVALLPHGAPLPLAGVPVDTSESRRFSRALPILAILSICNSTKVHLAAIKLVLVDMINKWPPRREIEDLSMKQRSLRPSAIAVLQLSSMSINISSIDGSTG